MTKEELKKEAEEWVKDHSGLIGSYEYVKYDYDSLIQAYLVSAESREERIVELEQELAEYKERAKTYLKYFIEILKRLGANKEPLVVETEQFLKDREVEK